jgi:dTDP-4-amino-4,6-dideoxygalactose transaminase
MLPISRPSLPPLSEYVEKLQTIWSTRLLSNFGSCAQELESIARNYTGNSGVRAVASCDTGLILSIAALEIPKGSECLLPSFTFNSTINAVLWNGLIPRFVDVDPATFNLDVDDAARRVGSATRLIVGTHVFGAPADLDRLLSLSAATSIPLVFDAAHAYGAAWNGVPIGDRRFGEFQVFSLSGTKQVTSAEGGLVAASTDALARKIELLRGYGFQHDYISHFVGVNGKMSELHAALGALTLPSVDDAVRRRNEIASSYRELLRGLDLAFQEVRPGSVSAFKDFAVICRTRRDELADHLRARGVMTKKYFVPLHHMPAYSRYRTADDDLAGTEDVAARILCLPIFNELTGEQVAMVAEIVHEFFDGA